MGTLYSLGYLLIVNFTIILSVCLADDISTAKLAPTFSTRFNAVTTGADFVAFLSSNVPVAGTFFGGVAALLHYIIGIRGTVASRELIAIKQTYEKMNERFDAVDRKLGDIKNQIDWNTLKLEFSDIQHHINAEATQLKDIYMGPLSNKNHAINYFKTSFKTDCTDCAMTLYNGIQGLGAGNPTKIFDVAMRTMKYDRPKMQNFMLGMYKLLVIAVNNEISYHRLTNPSGSVQHYVDQWKGRFNNVMTTMRNADKAIKDRYHTTADTDINDFAAKSENSKSKKNNNQFSLDLYHELVRKFDWRDWFVIVYDPVNDAYQKNHVCSGGFAKYNVNGRSIVVASVEKTKSHINTASATSTISHIPTTKKTCTECHGNPRCEAVATCRTNDQPPLVLYNSLPAQWKTCGTYAAAGAIQAANVSPARGLFKRYVFKNRMYVFG